MKNVCFLIGDLNHSGGTERVTTLIANSLIEYGYQVSILSLSNGDRPFFKLDSNILSQALFSDKVSMRKNFFEAVKKIRKFILDHKIESLIVVDSICCVFTVPACVGLKVKHICWEHFNQKVNLGSRFRDLGRWMAAKFCDEIITLTERDKFFWNERYHLKASNKVIAIPNPSPYSRQNIIPNMNSKTILAIGRLTHQKGFDLLIKAWSKVVVDLPEWKIKIVGIGEDESKLKQLVSFYGVTNSVFFEGQQKNLDIYYKNAAFFCLSSRYEGFGMVLIEALAYGLPILSYDCDCGPNEIIENDKNGFLVSSESVEGLASGIKKMAMMGTVEYMSKVQASFEKSDTFSVNNIIQKWLKVI
ncbi:MULTISPECIES: glycosyltransferase family 4 protein [Acinetobacter]|uniref:glycosyltransferase family 4 protein n=1 Tax=Acinetobacter TaxID=469 RepID=UPI0018DEA907|nr:MULTISPECIES: glycosyltransferase family 4 protein [Acinetobacter]MBI0396527.1 glycosyltransferase family 4 protein [Acinetobacter bereziniae]MBJ9374072.1 glycosyltransferase family 4 protein [Acinetobacter sp. TGL-Y2]MDQ9818696.1 glycosyltransferase family 4 protein [Acinetobacter bereziniae]